MHKSGMDIEKYFYACHIPTLHTLNFHSKPACNMRTFKFASINLYNGHMRHDPRIRHFKLVPGLRPLVPSRINYAVFLMGPIGTFDKLYLWQQFLSSFFLFFIYIFFNLYHQSGMIAVSDPPKKRKSSQDYYTNSEFHHTTRISLHSTVSESQGENAGSQVSTIFHTIILFPMRNLSCLFQ